MGNTGKAPTAALLIGWISWLCLGSAILIATLALLCQWGVNAESLGARDTGVAIFLAFVGAATLVASIYAAPVLGVLGVLSFAYQRPAAVRFLAAAAACALPIAVLTWLERT
jgi:hypothetical protein